MARRLPPIFLLELGLAASGSAAAPAAGRVRDDLALFQHGARAAHRELQPPRPVTVRRLTLEELKTATSHLRGEPLPWSPEVVSRRVRRARRRTRFGGGRPADTAVFRERRRKSDRHITNELIADNVASKLCTARFAAGYSTNSSLDLVLLDWLGGDLDTAMLNQRQCQSQVDEVGKVVVFKYKGAQSHPWKLVSERYGCTLASRLVFGWAKATAPSAVPRPRRTPTDSPNSRIWSPVSSDASRLEEADELVQAFARKVMVSNLSSSVAVLHQGRLVERYCGACGVTENTRQPGNSIGKAIEALLLSQWADEHGKDLDSTYALVPELMGGQQQAWGLTFGNLMNMVVASPPRDEELNMMGRVTYDAAEYSAVAAARVEKSIGEYYYSTGNYHILSRELRMAILAPTSNGTFRPTANATEGHALEMEYADYPWAKIFNVIGAESFVCERDMSGNLLMGTNCWATQRDWLKIGLLMLNKGVGPNGEQVVPTQTVADLFGDHKGYGTNSHYIYGWYRLDRMFPWQSCGPMLAAIGVGGNYLVVVPQLDLVVSRLSWRLKGDRAGGMLDLGNYGSGFLQDLMLGLVNKSLLGARVQ